MAERRSQTSHFGYSEETQKAAVKALVEISSFGVDEEMGMWTTALTLPSLTSLEPVRIWTCDM